MGIESVKVLVVAEDAEVLHSIQEALSSAPATAGFEVEAVPDAVAALDRLRRAPADVLLMEEVPGQAAGRRQSLGDARFYARLVDAVAEAVVATDLDCRITYFNRFAELMYGWATADVLGQSALEIIPAHMSREHVNQVISRLKAGESWSGELLVQRRDGSIFPALVTWAPIREDGEVVGTVLVSSDLTERKELEEQVSQAEMMEAVGRLAGGIAHDFNNLLTTIKGHADLLLDELPAGARAAQDLEEIRRSADRAASLTRQLLAFSRRQVLRPKVLDLNSVVRGIERMLRHFVGEGVELSNALEPELWRVKADPGQMEHVLMNLAVNSRDAMPKGGRFAVRTANVEVMAEAAPAEDMEPGRYVELAVSDTGSGMDEVTLSHMFEPFFTTKEHGKGTGLGLSTVYGIVKQSGGHIHVESRPGQGTTFHIYLPQVEEAAEPAQAASELVGSAQGLETVLVVEDEEAVRGLVRKVLMKRGYLVLEARSETEALRTASQYAGPIHLLLTDVVMPTISGPELARRISVVRPEIRVLYTSGYTEHEIVHRGVLEAGISFLEKPFTPELLARKVREVLQTQQAG
ncbi:MAG: PAS domain S-box protein [Gemmatimonadetes bacterium]|nr:PAS domain S-box protein [Gemmatimonadota bacterium]